MGFFKNLVSRLTSGPVDWDEVEEVLIRADLGVPMVNRLLSALRQGGLKVSADNVRGVLKQEILAALAQPAWDPQPSGDGPFTILLVGVNGTGKTTSCAKLAFWLKSQGHTPLLAAADTFRAAAIEQLVSWGSRLGFEVVRGQYQGDSAALCHDAWNSARRRRIPFLLCDTAGRLHTKGNLMQELGKVARTLSKQDPAAPHEKWIVVDATTGSNALVQATEFHKAVGLTGVVVTKLDGSGRGGIAVAIAQELGLPVRFTGFGERESDFRPFDPIVFVEGLLDAHG